MSQAQVIDHAQAMGWELRMGPDSSMIASRDGKTVVLPPSALTYSAEQSARLVAALDLNPYVPPARGRPGSAEFAEILDAYKRTGLPTVGVGRQYGPLVPQIRHPADDAPSLRSIDEDVAAVAKQRWPWAQPWHPGTVTVENRDDVLRRTALWSPETKRGTKATKWQPSRHVGMCMWAASGRCLRGWNDDQVGELIEAKDPRTVQRAVERGSAVWAAHGGWPWATRPQGDLGSDWWEANDTWDALIEAMELTIKRANRLVQLLRP